jgi:hypothetical protein
MFGREGMEKKSWTLAFIDPRFEALLDENNAIR